MCVECVNLAPKWKRTTCDAKLIFDNIHNWLPTKVSKGGKEKDNWRSLNLNLNVHDHWICLKWGNHVLKKYLSWIIPKHIRGETL
jgi:hypothetical protein